MATIKVRGTEKSVSLGIKNGEETIVQLTCKIRRAILTEGSLIDLDGVFGAVASPVVAPVAVDAAIATETADASEPVAPVRRGRKS